MTQNDENKRLNELIRQCDHEPIKDGRQIMCSKCGCMFAVMLLPVLRDVFPATDED